MYDKPPGVLVSCQYKRLLQDEICSSEGQQRIRRNTLLTAGLIISSLAAMFIWNKPSCISHWGLLAAVASVAGVAQAWVPTPVFVPTNYTVVPGIFIQDSSSFNATGYNVLNDTFGLIDKSPNGWKNLTSWVDDLNKNSDGQTAYKLIIIARHGEGFHNVAEARYGTPAWNCYWSELTTDGNITWGPDAAVTATGTAQALAANAAWKQQIGSGAPIPASFYTSPMRRATATLNLTWSDITLNKGVVPLIKEGLRESIGLHTCDQRSRKSEIAARHPGWKFDPSFSEQDELWNPVYEETSPQQALRTQQVLNEIFATDSNSVISITGHGGTISAFFTVVNHNRFSVQPGGFVPVLVKAVGYLNATQALITGGQSATAPLCTANPTTAVMSPATATVPPSYAPTTTTSPTARARLRL